MTIGGDWLTTHEVSDLLGVEARRVRRLAAGGSISRVARGVFDRRSVERYRAERGTGRTRTWAEHTSWGAIALLSGSAPRGLGDVQTHRLRATLLEIADPTELVLRLRNRAAVTTWSGHRSAGERVRAELVVPGRARLGLVEDEALVDGYVHDDQFADLVRRFRLREDPSGAITLRRTSMDVEVVRDLASASTALAAVDAATSLDPRERGVGERYLAQKMELLGGDERR